MSRVFIPYLVLYVPVHLNTVKDESGNLEPILGLSVTQSADEKKWGFSLRLPNYNRFKLT
jgi:hypothetical protein